MTYCDTCFLRPAISGRLCAGCAEKADTPPPLAAEPEAYDVVINEWDRDSRTIEQQYAAWITGDEYPESIPSGPCPITPYTPSNDCDRRYAAGYEAGVRAAAEWLRTGAGCTRSLDSSDIHLSTKLDMLASGVLSLVASPSRSVPGTVTALGAFLWGNSWAGTLLPTRKKILDDVWGISPFIANWGLNANFNVVPVTSGLPNIPDEPVVVTE